MTASPEPLGQPRQRASIACQSCNRRRVKCNAATVGIPCSPCQRAGRRECKLIESKRGKRKAKATGSARTAASNPALVGGDNIASGALTGKDGQDEPQEQASEPNSSLSIAGNTAETMTKKVGSVTAGTAPEDTSTGGEPKIAESEDQDGREGPETLYAQMLETDRSWSNKQRRKLMKPGGQVVYLGETFNLTYLLHHDEREDCKRLHYPLPIEVTKSSSIPEKKSKDGRSLLQLQGAFDVPNSYICLELFKTYFEHVAPHYPIIDRSLFLIQYAIPQSPPSWLLLQAVLFMAAGHCEEALLKEAGFESRYDARLTLFRRTKALYDADHETDKVTIIQAVFLMSFWWATPVDSKDTWHWLGIAISLALTIGMHRSTKDSCMSLKDQRLWKRIWWSLFTEEKHAAAALGRPVHIRLSDCDVEQLEVSDFDEEPSGSGKSSSVGLPNMLTAYPIFLTSLSKIVERIIEKSSPTAQTNTLELCEGMLQVWEAGLPDVLRLSSENDTIWPNMLHIALCWFRILAHRTRTPNDPSISSRDNEHEKAMSAANQMVRIVEDLLAFGQIRQCPIHIIPALFAAMSMLATRVRSGDEVSQQLAYVKVRLCMIALRELQSSWPVSGWIFLLFAKIVKGIRDEDDARPDARVSNQPNTRPTNEESREYRSRRNFRAQAAPQSQNNGHEQHWPPSPLPNAGLPTGYNYPNSTMCEPSATPNNQLYPMPFDLSTDWSGVRDQDLWLVPGFDFFGDMPGGNESGGFSGA